MTSEPAGRASRIETCFLLQAPRRNMAVGLGIIAGFALTALLVQLQTTSAALAYSVTAGVTCLFVFWFGGWALRRVNKGVCGTWVPILRLMPDGSTVVFNQTRPCSAEPVRMRFVWRGPRSIRLVLASSTGGATDWRLYKSDLSAPQWRALCRWTVWLERGGTSS